MEFLLQGVQKPMANGLTRRAKRSCDLGQCTGAERKVHSLKAPKPNRKPSRDEHILIEVYKSLWADIHHSRRQDLYLLTLILTGIASLVGLDMFGRHQVLQLLLAFSFSVISLFAAGVSHRHKMYRKVKLNAVGKIEHALDLDKLHLSATRLSGGFFCTQNLLTAIYLTFALFSGFVFAELAARAIAPFFQSFDYGAFWGLL